MPKAAFAPRLRRVAARKKPTPAGLPDHKTPTHENVTIAKPLENLNCLEKLERDACKPSMSGSFQQVVNSLSAVKGTVFSEFQVRCGAKTSCSLLTYAAFVARSIHPTFELHGNNANIISNPQHTSSSNGSQAYSAPQMKLLKQATAVLADAAVGQAAPPSLRLLVRRALRIAVLATSAATHITKMWALAAAVAHCDSPQVLLGNVVELMCIASGLLSPAVIPSSPLLRVASAATALASEGLSLSAAVDRLSHVDPQNLDLEAVVLQFLQVLDLASSGAGLLESGQEVAVVAQELMAAKQ
ncbi:hypothetical protein VaNZ11_015513 [Volvox africanus]|uniref:Cyclin N-terminal domain-containing protein n=1 Tax=Volvox africanus TaxID=51714 RepID=A0ABQ5SL31_9CHLO|nr:hypothetical protein VaNZ11_015513 [Volvox africanus]